MRSWLTAHRERLAYGFAVALLVVSVGATSAGAVLLRQSANDQRQEARLHQRQDAAVRRGDVAAARAADAAFMRVSEQAHDRVPYARWTLATAAIAFVLLIVVLGRLFVLQRRAGRIDRDNAQLRDEFVAIVSHELRTPLTSIIGYIELIGDDEQGALSTGQAEYFDVVKRNADRLLYLVSDLLLIAESDGGTIRLERQDVDVAALVADSVGAARAAAERKDIELESSAATATLHADPLRLAQVLDNLLSNAIKFTPDGGRVAVSAATAGDDLLFEVTDTGIGIASVDRTQVFERFFRARRTTQDRITGAGLGLAITKAIVEAHGGSIAFDSEVGVGTTFRVRLPLPQAETNSSLLPQGSPA